MTESPHDESPNVLFAETGASWWWLLAGPAAGLAMMLIQLNSGLGLQWVVPVAFLVVVSAFLALQIKAARIHTSVELTPETLRQGVETIRIDEIVSVYPEPRNPSRNYLDTRMSRTPGPPTRLMPRPQQCRSGSRHARSVSSPECRGGAPVSG